MAITIEDLKVYKKDEQRVEQLLEISWKYVLKDMIIIMMTNMKFYGPT